MDAAEARAALECAIVDVCVAEGWIDAATDLMTGFAIIAAFDTGEDTSRYIHVFPSTQPYHTCIGLHHTAIVKMNNDAYDIPTS